MTHRTAVVLVPGILLVLLAGASAASSASAGELPTPVAGKDSISAEIEPVGESDEYAVTLFPGDRLTMRSKSGGNVPGLLTTFTMRRPNGSPATPKVSGNGGKAVTLTYTAADSGVHVLKVVGGAGTSFGSHGGYKLTFSVSRAKIRSQTFALPAGGAIAYRFGATDRAVVVVSASTKKGGFDLTGLTGPAGDETGFAGAVKAPSNRRSAKVGKWTVKGGAGEYELQGAYDAGSSVKIAVTVKHAEKSKSRRLGLEPVFKRGTQAVFPTEGIVGTQITVEGESDIETSASTFTYVNTPPRPRRPGDPGTGDKYDDPLEDVYPRFFVGAIEVPRATIVRTSGAFRFPAPPGLVVGPAYDVVVQNADGQRASAEDAYTIVPPPAPTGLATVSPPSALEAGPVGGRRLRITGSLFRSGTIVVFDPDATHPTIVLPTIVLPGRIDVTAPEHVAGPVTLRLRDEFLQTADVPGTLTYLDIPSNKIISIDKPFLQALGGETVVVTGRDFAADTVLTADGTDTGATLDSPTQMTFTSRAHVDGTVSLRVTDETPATIHLEQTSALTFRVKGFLDQTSTIFPGPRTLTDEVDGWRASRVLVGDVTGDGRKDIVLLQHSAAFGTTKSRSRVRVLAAGSTPSTLGIYVDLTSAVIPAVSGDEDWRARDAVLTDLNGDGTLDLALITNEAVSSGNRSSLRLLRNDISTNGAGIVSGVFTDRTSAWAPASTTTYLEGKEDRNQGVAIVAADVDHAGGTDLVIVHTEFFTEQYDTPIEGAMPPDPLYIRTTNYFAAVRVLTNDGTGKLTRTSGRLPAVLPTDVQQFQADTMAAADVDGNGYVDLVLTRDQVTEGPAATYHRTAILLTNSGGTFTDTSAASLPAASDPDYLQADRVFLRDVAGDSKPDILLLSNTALTSPGSGAVSTSPSLRLLVNSGGTFTAAAPGTFPAKRGNDVSQGEDLAIGDLDGDGTPDIVIVSANAPNGGDRACRILRKSGSAWVDASPALPSVSAGDDFHGDGVALIDVAGTTLADPTGSGDGDLDIVVVRNDADESVVNTRLVLNPRK